MENSDDKIRQLEERIATLEEHLAALADRHRREVKALMGCDDVLDKHRKAMLAELEDAFQRIINIELTLFPHLLRDIGDLNRVIGDQETKAYNPLDFRDRTGKSG